jgi:exoribonuclease-2
VLKDGLVRADTLPLVFRALGCEGLPRGAHVRVRVTGCDLLTLDLHASLLARLDDTAPAATGLAEPEAEEAEEEEEASGPLALAIDVADADATGAAEPPAPAA